MSERPEDLEAAIALLTDALRGAVEWEIASGGDALPRPRRPKPRPKAGARATPAEAPAARVPAPRVEAPRVEAPRVEAPTAEVTSEPPVEAPAASQAQPSIAALLRSDRDSPSKLHVLENEIIGACTRCKLHRGRTNLVFGVGNPEADLVFVGEGPGAEEDRQGIPFVGRAGQLLTKMIAGMGRTRDQVYICNVVKCRPPNNRDPEPDEVEACEPFLKAQLAVLQPKVIVTLGRYAAHALLRTNRPISRLRGNWFEYEGVPLMPTFHPAYLLRNEEMKRPTWQDLKQVMARLDQG